jgi:Protein of unknown function (DUF1761)
MPFNIIAVLVATLATLLVGFVWYNPKVFGTIWMNETGMTEEKAKQGNMLKIFGFTILFSMLISFSLTSIVIHQSGVFALVEGNANDETYKAFMAVHGDAFRSYKHGALHGFFFGLLFVFPVMGVNAMFDQKSWKLLFVTSGYWIVSLTIMGAIICGWK